MNKKKKSFILVLGFIVAVTFLLFNIDRADNIKIDDTGDFEVTISIECATILNNYDKLDDSLKDEKYIPEDGTILKSTTVWVNDGESVLDVLKKVTAKNGIQMEYTQSPNDSYIEGINYIYEFSCGELSGWMYKVNNEFANVGCNSYIVSPQDNIEWVYTCNLGEDVGDDF